MARDRERARDRKARRKGLERGNVPGPLDHASGEVDEFQAEMVAGAGGDPASAREEAALEREALEAGGAGGGAGDEPPTDRGDSAGGAGGGAGGETPTDRGASAGGGGIGRFPGFVKACWAELQRVQWPDRRQVGQATMVVLGFVALAGIFLGLMDLGATELVDLVIF